MKKVLSVLFAVAMFGSSATISHAGPMYQGPQWNGPQWNGPQFNGPQFNGPQYNGPQFNGPQFNTAVIDGRGATNSYVTAVDFSTAKNASGTAMTVTMSGSELQGLYYAGSQFYFLQGTALIGTTFKLGIGWADSSTVRWVNAKIVEAVRDTSTNVAASSANNRNDGYKVVNGSTVTDPNRPAVWLYRIQIATNKFAGRDLEIDTRTGLPKVYWVDTCGDGGAGPLSVDRQAMFYKGSFLSNGTFIDSSALTFGCTSGTAVKAARGLGYKPWVTYTGNRWTRVNSTWTLLSYSVDGRDLWANAANALMANYCLNGTSYTTAGQYVDIEDKYGIVVKSAEDYSSAAFAPESAWGLTSGLFSGTYFNQPSLVTLSGPRIVSLSSASVACSPTISSSTVVADENTSFTWNFATYSTPESTGSLVHSFSEAILGVANSNLCSHKPSASGAGLDPLCNPCTKKLWDARTSNGMTGCFLTCNAITCNPGNWDAVCASKASSQCTIAEGRDSGQ